MFALSDNKPWTGAGVQGAKRVAATLLRPYAQVYFAKSPWVGFLFAAATFLAPLQGLSGLIGLIAADLIARWLGQPKDLIDRGFFGFNGLLVGLAIGLYYNLTVPMVGFLVLAVFFSVVVGAVLHYLTTRYIGVPVLSTPFVFAVWAALLATRRFSEAEFALEPILVTHWGAGLLPAGVELYLRSLGAAFFQLSVASGLLVFLGLLIFSRWAVLLSMFGFAGGWIVYSAMGGSAVDLSSHLIGFNFILAAVAVGGMGIVLSVSSIVYSIMAGALAAMLAAGMLALLGPYQLPVLAMPFILATQLMLFVVMVRTGKGALELVNGEWETPESNLNRARYRHERYPDPAVPVVYLPVSGRWMISQGPDGEHTHQGAWAHAWDFEVDDEKGKKHRNGGTTPDDFYAYDAPVYAPADGKVVRVVDAIEDNPVGEVDTANNWGNLVILWHSGQVYSALCHLKKGSIAVAEGQPVVRGQILGKLGNSGRSPIPHLHYQLQASPEIGAPTLKGEFLHYVVENGHGKQYVTHGVPDLGQEVVPLATDENVRRAVTLAPGREWTWAVSRGAERFEETWESRIDPLGARKIVEKRKRGQAASLSFYADDAYMTALEYEGASRRLLGLLYLGLPRVPFAKDHDLTWSDNLSAAAFLNPAANLLRDLFLPVRELVRMRSHSSMRWAEHGLVVTTHLEINSDLPFTVDRAVPERIEVHCIPDMGPVAIRAYRNDHLICQADLIS